MGRAGRLRIVAGRFGGRFVEAPAGDRTRPTTERVREALFSMLGDAVAGARVADLFAGSGAMGLEALSRGAAHLTSYEVDRRALTALRRNVAALGVGDDVDIVSSALPDALRPGPPWDLVVLDPPWGKGLGERALERVVAAGRLSEGAVVVVEERRGWDPGAAWWREHGLRVERRRRYGDTELTLAVASERGRSQ